ncbi:MAG: arginyltransferase [Tepidisphaeraceae bacterium]
METVPDFSHCPHIPPPRSVRMVVLPPSTCSYLPGRASQSRALLAASIPPDVYHDFMDAGFRRSGRMLYQPICVGCRECRAIRVPVDTFGPSKSQRRSMRRNADLIQTVGPPDLTPEKFDLYRRYVLQWHRHEHEPTMQELEEFLFDSPITPGGTIEICHRDPTGKLLGVGICDLSVESLSSVYFFFDPDEAGRGIGTFSALHEIEFARTLGVPHYYLGYYVAACETMAYKANFEPYELLGMDGQWRRGTS